MATQGRDPSKGTATRVLIDLAALIRAYEVLEVLPTLLPGCTDSLLDQVVQTAVALASPIDAARVCLESIYTSPSFPSAYAGLVLLALCHVNPKGWLDYVEDLAQPMRALASRLEDDSTALHFYACGILDAINLSRLRSADLNRLQAVSDWLFAEWFHGSSSLLCYEPNAKPSPRLWRRDNSAVSVRSDKLLEIVSSVTVREASMQMEYNSRPKQPANANDVAHIKDFRQRKSAELGPQETSSFPNRGKEKLSALQHAEVPHGRNA